MAMANIQAFLVITLLTLAAVSVSGTAPELFTTTGGTVNMPCLFGEGKLRSIFWYYIGRTGPQKILFLAEGNLTIEAEYANRTSLQDDNSTLILKDITVADEGTYRCDVDRQGQTLVPDINTKLYVFSLRPNTFPVISPCTWTDDASSCSIHANQSFTLTCTLPNVYHVEYTELIWYQDGKSFSSTNNVTQNEDGTTDISRRIQVSQTGNFTCNATYLLATGRENTAVSIEAWVIPPADSRNTTEKNMSSGQIVGTTICIVLFVGISLAIITVLDHSQNRGQWIFKKDTQTDRETRLNLEASKLVWTSTVIGSDDEKGVTSTKTLAATAPTTKTTMETISEAASHPMHAISNAAWSDLNYDSIFGILAKHMPSDKYTLLCAHLGIEYNESNNILERLSNDSQKATRFCLAQWKTRTGGDKVLLKTILQDIGVGDLTRYIQ